MYKCILYLKNEFAWIEYAKKIISNTDNITDKTIADILTFPFEFGSLNSDT